MKNINIIFCCILTLALCEVMGQNIDTSIQSTNKITFSFNGYIKSMSSLVLPVMKRPIYYGHLLHNRLNFKTTSSRFNTALEIRNRLLWNYTPTPIVYATIERAWLEYKSDKWSIKGGRQRINWGMNNTWNPNDIFNTYNLFDFDYEERAGTDGIRIHHQLTGMSALELAVAKNSQEKKLKSALKYNFNLVKYDLQLIAGYYHNRWTAGWGWQGSLDEIGFKGELQYFAKNKQANSDLNLSIEFDYITKNGWYLLLGGLFNGNGMLKFPNEMTIIKFDNSPENLMPSRWNLLAGCSKEINPIINFRFNYLYLPISKLMILFPSITFNIKTNFDVDVFWQSYWGTYTGIVRPLNHMAYFRAKLFF